MNVSKAEILAFMNSKEYDGMPFAEMVKKFDLTKEELIQLLQEVTGTSPLTIKKWTEDEIVIV